MTHEGIGKDRRERKESRVTYLRVVSVWSKPFITLRLPSTPSVVGVSPLWDVADRPDSWKTNDDKTEERVRVQGD